MIKYLLTEYGRGSDGKNIWLEIMAYRPSTNKYILLSTDGMNNVHDM